MNIHQQNPKSINLQLYNTTTRKKFLTQKTADKSQLLGHNRRRKGDQLQKYDPERSKPLL